MLKPIEPVGNVLHGASVQALESALSTARRAMRYGFRTWQRAQGKITRGTAAVLIGIRFVLVIARKP